MHGKRSSTASRGGSKRARKDVLISASSEEVIKNSVSMTNNYKYSCRFRPELKHWQH